MNKRLSSIFVATLVLCISSSALAEQWPTLQEYVDICEVIVKAHTVVTVGKRCEFEFIEVWKGNTNAIALNKDNRYVDSQGTHGIQVTNGQDIVFFFSRHNNPSPPNKIKGHGTAFPIRNGIIIYASTSDFMTEEMTVAEFKKRILELPTEK